MSEILSEDELRDLSIMGPGWLTQKQLDRIIASHRQLRAERDALTQERDEFRSCNEHHKAQFLQTNAALAAMRKERDALKAELAEAKWARGDFEQAPCFLCGYNGSGYYQPSQHACAEEYHRRKEAQP